VFDAPAAFGGGEEVVAVEEEGELVGLIVAAAYARPAVDFVESSDVGVAEELGDAGEVEPAIRTDAAVDVEGGEAENGRRCAGAGVVAGAGIGVGGW
jgi:hypothetical protein